MLKFFPPYQNLSALRVLKIWQCKALRYISGLEMMESLEKLEIIYCPKFNLSPVQRLPSKLKFLLISNCPSLLWLPGLQQLPFMLHVHIQIFNCPKLREWCRIYNICYNNKESLKALFARSSQEIQLSQEEASVLLENICVLDYDEAILQTEEWLAIRLLGLYICSCAHLKYIMFGDNFIRLKQLRIWNCSHLEKLHGLWQLTSLQDMDINKCPNLKSLNIPTNLQSLAIDRCNNLRHLGCGCPINKPSSSRAKEASLRHLKISKCPKLFHIEEPLRNAAPYFEISACPELQKWCQEHHITYFQDVSKLKKLTIDDISIIISYYRSGNLVSLETLHIFNSGDYEFPKDEWIPCSLHTLHLNSCPRLKFFPPHQNLSALRLLKIWQCKALRYISGLQMMESLENLEIIDCPQFTLSPVQRLPSKLKFLLISNCPSLLWLPGLQQLFSLRDLSLYGCLQLMFPPLEQLPFMIHVQLEIFNCPKLIDWCRRNNVGYNNKESPKALFARSSQEIQLSQEEASVLLDNICVLDYDEPILETEEWLAVRLLGLYICSCARLKSISFGNNFIRLKQLRIWSCSHLKQLDGLWKLTSLQDMDINKCPNLDYLNIPKNLQSLKIDRCNNLRYLDCGLVCCLASAPRRGLEQPPIFNNLRLLKISKCPKLLKVDEWLTKAGTYVEISACPELQAWCQKHHFAYFQDVSKLKKLTIDDISEITPDYGSGNLVPLEILHILNCNDREFPKDEWIPCSLHTLHLNSCLRLKFFPPYQNLSALRLLKIWQCKALRYISGLQMMESLENLEIIDCPKFTLSPVQRLPSKLKFLLIDNCPRILWLPGLQQLFSLRDLRLYECLQLMLPPLEQLSFMLHVHIEIFNCPKVIDWCRRNNLGYNNKESPKALFARSSEEIQLWQEEASVLLENICVLDYDEPILEAEEWLAIRLLGLYICSCAHLKYITFGDNFIRLEQLRIWNCSHLEQLYCLWKLTSLQDMDINMCPNLDSLNIPTSIQSLAIDRCNNLWRLACVRPRERKIFRLSSAPAPAPSLEQPPVLNNLRFLKISKCPKLSSVDESLTNAAPYVEISACPKLQKWCQKHHIAYFQD